MSYDQIAAADAAEEQTAAMALRSTHSPNELLTVWNHDCEHFRGAARERLQAEYARQLRRMGAFAA